MQIAGATIENTVVLDIEYDDFPSLSEGGEILASYERQKRFQDSLWRQGHADHLLFRYKDHCRPAGKGELARVA